MKSFKFSLLALLLVFSMSAKSETIADVAIYHAVPGSTFTYSHTFPELNHISFSLPFAQSMYISGNHLEFSITYDDFVWFICRRKPISSDPTNQYFDFLIDDIDRTMDGRSDGNWDPSAGSTSGNSGGMGFMYVTNQVILRVYYYS